jgi:hypothetical protein
MLKIKQKISLNQFLNQSTNHFQFNFQNSIILPMTITSSNHFLKNLKQILKINYQINGI